MNSRYCVFLSLTGITALTTFIIIMVLYHCPRSSRINDCLFNGHGTHGSLLTRFGKDLALDLSTCPAGSIMTPRYFDARQSQPPLHEDCPDLFIIGVRKGGTTSLIQYLSKHPEFTGPHLHKGPMAGETFYFNNITAMSWEKYKAMFPKGKRMTGESSVDYFDLGPGPERIYENCGTKPKIVLLLRDPVDRFVSNFVMKSLLHSDYGKQAVTRVVTSKTRVHDVVNKEIAAYKSSLPNMFRRNEISVPSLSLSWSLFRSQFTTATSMLFHGLYFVHVMNWFCNFPAENILIVNSEEFFKNPSMTLKQISDFIGLRPLSKSEYDRITSVVYNVGGYNSIPSHHKITLEDRAKLAAIYKPFNKLLLDLLDWPLKWDGLLDLLDWPLKWDGL